MIQAIREMIFHLMIVMVLSGVMELLLPDGATQPFVRMVMGLSVLAVCLEPILQMSSG